MCHPLRKVSQRNLCLLYLLVFLIENMVQFSEKTLCFWSAAFKAPELQLQRHWVPFFHKAQTSPTVFSSGNLTSIHEASAAVGLASASYINHRQPLQLSIKVISDIIDSSVI